MKSHEKSQLIILKISLTILLGCGHHLFLVQLMDGILIYHLKKKDLLFEIIDYLVRKGDIKFLSPNADCYVSLENKEPALSIENEKSHWNEDPEVVVKYLSSKWPDGVVDMNDINLTMYFYEIPAIIWVKNRKFFSS